MQRSIAVENKINIKFDATRILGSFLVHGAFSAACVLLMLIHHRTRGNMIISATESIILTARTSRGFLEYILRCCTIVTESHLVTL